MAGTGPAITDQGIHTMANISAQMVKELRESTGAGMMDCKAALTETNGDMTEAQDWLRKKGLSKAAKKAGRVAAEGLIGVQVKGTKGVVRSEEHTSELQSLRHLVCRLLLEKKKKNKHKMIMTMS